LRVSSTGKAFLDIFMSFPSYWGFLPVSQVADIKINYKDFVDFSLEVLIFCGACGCLARILRLTPLKEVF